MPKRTDINKILIIGSGPIIIGQACEFDYSGTQACKALKEEGYKVILVNSNPATIMTDPDFADRTYVEPVTPEIVEKIIIAEKPDALLPTIGGQTGLNTAASLARRGILQKHNVDLIGASFEAISKAEDRILFKQAMQKIGLDLPESGFAYNIDEALRIAEKIGYPLIIRPAFTLGGTGGGIANNEDELKEQAALGISYSQIGQVLVEQSVIGWKEFELEVMRDLNDNVVIICPIENFDPMGVHTGDSITVAPAQTLTDKEYQKLRDFSIACMREIGVDTGGSNIQFAINPKDGRIVIIEMNPRVSRSSALASKATGFPIAKIAAKLAVGYTLDEIPNDITKKTPACFEPTIDYVVTKIPRFAFEKFPGSDTTLTTMMKSVGETMALGRTFKESLQKALRSLEIGLFGLEDLQVASQLITDDRRLTMDDGRRLITEKLKRPNSERLLYIKKAFSSNFTVNEICRLTKIDPWFIEQVKEIYDFDTKFKTFIPSAANENILKETLREAKRNGFSDRYLGKIWNKTEIEIRSLREKHSVKPVYKMVDTCAAEFEAFTPYLYSTYENEDESNPTKNKKIIILGGGPNRIGQGIEFDYCCVHASFALKEEGFETIMVNSNPETVSTDYDTSDRLYFEPLTLEDVLNIVENEKPIGVIIQFGGQTPLNLAVPLEKAGVKILGTSSDSVDRAENRQRFTRLLDKLKVPQAKAGHATSFTEAKKVAQEIGYPVLVRPSYVLGGRAMQIVYDESTLENYMVEAVKISPDHPILIDKFLEAAIEVDVDCVSDGKECLIAGIMEHIEEAGIHSGDSACVIPAYSLDKKILNTIKEYTFALAKDLHVIGLMNIQYAVKDNIVYVLEVNPRASRTVPFVSKATGVPWAKTAARIISGKTLKDLKIKEIIPKHFSVKEAVFPFSRFTEQDIILGPEMHSTGEVMGIDNNFGIAYAKSQMGAGEFVPQKGKIFISVNDRDKKAIIPIAKRFADLKFEIFSTAGTSGVLNANGIKATEVKRISEGSPNIVDYIKNDEIKLLINTPLGKGPRADDYQIRREALMHKVLCVTTISAAKAMAEGIESLQKEELKVRPLQDYFQK